MINTLISICIPTYNGEKYLQEALDSVKNQTYKNIEVIISDDQSKDNTLEIAKKFKNEVKFPVYIYSHEPNGIGANWNNCIQKSNGDYIKILFQDDILELDCIELMYQYLIKNNLEIVISKRKIIDENSKIVSKGSWYSGYNDLQKMADLNFEEFTIFNKKIINKISFKRFISDNIFGEPCVSLYSKKLYKKIGGYDEKLKQILDYTFYLKGLKHYNIGIIDKKLISFRIHKDQATKVNEKNNVSESNELIEHIFKLFFWNLNLANKKIILKHRYPKFYNKMFKLRYRL